MLNSFLSPCRPRAAASCIDIHTVRRWAAVALGCCALLISSAQNVVVSGALAGNGSYATLRAAFAALNGGAQTGAIITVNINASTTEALSAVLNAGAWTSVLVKPNGGAARTINSLLDGVPTIDLSGADNVTIDGQNSGGNSLTIINTSVSSAAGTATVRFQNDATNNLLTRCSMLGSSTGLFDNATVLVGAGAINTGNDGNTISLCDIGPTATGLPTQSVLCSGTTSTAVRFNSGVTITQCNIFDYFNATNASYGVAIADGNTDQTVSNNKFYQTSTREKLGTVMTADGMTVYVYTKDKPHQTVCYDNLKGRSKATNSERDV